MAYFMGNELNQPLKGYLFLTLKQQYLFLSIYNTFFIFYGAIYINRLKAGSSVYLKKKIAILLPRIFVITFLTVIPGLVLLFLLNLKSNHVGMINFYNPGMVNTNYLFFQSLILPLCFFFVPNWLYNEKGPFSFLDKLRFYGEKEMISTRNEDGEIQLDKKSDLDLILRFIETEKPYLNSRFSLHDISRTLNIPHLRVSNCFNNQLNVPFPTYRNKLRIGHAKTLLQNGAHLNRSIEGIAEMSGFKSKSIFYKIFKEEYGTTPIEWIKENT
jgi:AraC-like DNA-binding protein